MDTRSMFPNLTAVQEGEEELKQVLAQLMEENKQLSVRMLALGTCSFVGQSGDHCELQFGPARVADAVYFEEAQRNVLFFLFCWH